MAPQRLVYKSLRKKAGVYRARIGRQALSMAVLHSSKTPTDQPALAFRDAQPSSKLSCTRLCGTRRYRALGLLSAGFPAPVTHYPEFVVVV